MAQKKVQSTPVSRKGLYLLKSQGRELAKKLLPAIKKAAEGALKDEFFVKSFLSETGKKALRTEGNEKLLKEAKENALKCMIREIKKNL